MVLIVAVLIVWCP